ncbi:MAG: hypothetical protein WCQ70_06425 [Lentimicrobiaceae bacterium]
MRVCISLAHIGLTWSIVKPHQPAINLERVPAGCPTMYRDSLTHSSTCQRGILMDSSAGIERVPAGCPTTYRESLTHSSTCQREILIDYTTGIQRARI